MGRANARTDDRFREAIHRSGKQDGLLRRFASRNDDGAMGSPLFETMKPIYTAAVDVIEEIKWLL
jgi:hypothetical protein